jgi:hypothetical protein
MQELTPDENLTVQIEAAEDYLDKARRILADVVAQPAAAKASAQATAAVEALDELTADTKAARDALGK